MFSLGRVPTLAPTPSPTPCLFRHPIPTPVSLSIHYQPPRRSIEIANAFSLPGGNCYNWVNKLISRTLSLPLGLIRS
jgi:hypothetical protein